MKLSLSARVAESFSDKTKADMSLEQLAELALTHGYHAVCMRASQLGTHSSDEEVRQAREMLTRHRLPISMVTGDFAIPQNSDDEGPLALRNITPHLDLSAALGADLMRICMKRSEDIQWARRAADEAAERGMRLAHQSHTASLFEEVGRSLEVIAGVDRPNFGLIYEPVNLDACGQDYGRDTIERLAPHMFNVYLQNHIENPQGEGVLNTWCRGPVHFDHIPVWESGGMDFPGIFDGPGGDRLRRLCHGASSFRRLERPHGGGGAERSIPAIAGFLRRPFELKRSPKGNETRRRHYLRRPPTSLRRIAAVAVSG